MDIRNFYSGKKVMVTGHTGFKGSWLCVLLKELGAEVIGFGLEAQPRGLFSQIGLKDKITSITGNITDFEEVLACVNKYKPDMIIHLAAQAIVLEGYENPYKTFNTNILGTLNVLESIRQNTHIKASLIVTTDKCYDNKESEVGYEESDRLGPSDPYGSSKACAELITRSYRLSFLNGIGIATARAGNAIGGGDYGKHRIIPNMLRALDLNKPLKIRIDGAVRPWHHVLDTVMGYLILLNKLFEDSSYSGSWNFGPANSFTNEDLMDIFIQEYGKGSYVVDESKDYKEAKLLYLDTSKTEQRLSWKPILDIRSAVKWTVEWYKSENKESITQKQIEDYLCKLI